MRKIQKTERTMQGNENEVKPIQIQEGMVMQNSNKSKRKIALITGVSGGMGLAAAKRLIRDGYQVFGLDRKAPPKQIRGLCFVEADLTAASDVQRAYEAIASKTSKLDCIVHFAGIYDLNSLVEMSENDFIRIFNINLFANFRVNKTFLPLLKKGGRILITTSELAPLSPLPFTGIYAISKTALEHYAVSLRRELQLLGIRVIILRPGAVDTGLLNVSTDRLSAFSKNTSLYPHNAERFRSIVDRVEARKIAAAKIAELTSRVLSAKNPRLVYQINRNPLLLLMNILPEKGQDLILREILRR